MDVVEAPRMIDDYIAEGNVVLISLDPIASVAGLQDEQATLEASLLPRGKYLAVAETFHGFDLSRHVSEMPLEFSFFSVSHNLPDPSFCAVSLTPTAALDRPAVVPSPPLPWSECYVHTMRCFFARISRVHLAGSAEPSVLSEEQRMDIARAVIGDQMDTMLPMRDIDGEPVRVPVRSQCGSECEACRSNRGGSRRSASPPTERTESASMDESHAGREGELPEDGQLEGADLEEWILQRADPRRAYAHVEVWLDLSSAADFDEPDELMHGIRRILQIERNSARRKLLRMLADQPRTAQWAQDVAAADQGQCSESADSHTGKPPRFTAKKGHSVLAGVLGALRSTLKRVFVTTGALGDRVRLLTL